jgi:hypothetical protein
MHRHCFVTVDLQAMSQASFVTRSSEHTNILIRRAVHAGLQVHEHVAHYITATLCNFNWPIEF